MYNVPVHYVSTHIFKAFDKYDNARIENLHQTGGGWKCLLFCRLTDQAYEVTVKPLNCSEKGAGFDYDLAKELCKKIDEQLGYNGVFYKN